MASSSLMRATALQRLSSSLSRIGIVPFPYAQQAMALTPSRSAQAIRCVHSGNFKTRSSIKKRFRVKPNGSIVRHMSGKRHLNMGKSRERVNRLGATGVITAPGIRKKYLRIMQVSPLR